jgi:hypothetical protein
MGPGSDSPWLILIILPLCWAGTFVICTPRSRRVLHLLAMGDWGRHLTVLNPPQMSSDEDQVAGSRRKMRPSELSVSR